MAKTSTNQPAITRKCPQRTQPQGKGNELESDYYIKELLYPNVINTAPLDTIKAFIKADHTPKEILEDSVLDKFFADAKNADIDYDDTCKTLLDDGLKAFCDAFEEILKSLR